MYLFICLHQRVALFIAGNMQRRSTCNIEMEIFWLDWQVKLANARAREAAGTSARCVYVM